nr:reverse transcriptase domain-containing protein [Tanacetum cinerariifolium]
MTGIPRSITEHRLNIRERCQPIRQKRRGQAPDRNKAIQEEVTKFVKAKIMREVHYHDWLSNPIMVKKHDGSWRMCVDFTGLNKSCPKYYYPLLKIDWKVESLCGYPFKCFLDTYKGYHHIQMVEEDEEKTVFHTNQGVFSYTKIPRCSVMDLGMPVMSVGFQENMYRLSLSLDFFYANDMAQECSFFRTEHAFFQIELHVYSSQVAKCFFDVSKYFMLGVAFYHQVIYIYLKVLANLFSKCFIHKPLSDFQWTLEVERVFQGIKQCIAELPLVIAPRPKEELIMYLCAAREAVSAVLLAEKDSQQILVYFVSRALTSIRDQILADFIAERPDEEDPPVETPAEEVTPESWTLFTDESSCLEGSGAGLILTSLEGEEFTYALRFEFDASNNKAKYEALIAGLRIAKQMEVKNLVAKVDSRLVAN